MQPSIQRLEPDSPDALFGRVLTLKQAINSERDPACDADSEALIRAGIRGTETFEQQTLVAVADDQALGLAVVYLTHLNTNIDKIEVRIEVHPQYRRGGVGTALLSAVLDLAEANGRTSLVGVGVTSKEAKGFWEGLGAEPKTVERESRLWLADTDEVMMREWEAKRSVRAADYRLEHFRGATPAQLLAALAHLNTVMNDAPTDDLDWDDDLWTEDDVRQFDELIIGRGRELWTSIVFGPAGEPAGFTSISTQRHKPRFALQGNTAVDPAHRKRGIGRWLKADMWLRLRSDAAHVEAIDTDNAESNDPMLAINVAMGFAPLLEWSVWQADVSALRVRIKSAGSFPERG